MAELIKEEEFVPFHLHTRFSIYDGCIKSTDLVSRCKSLGIKAATITDHGAMGGIVEFASLCQAAGIKPLIGCEVYVNDGRELLLSKDKEDDEEDYTDSHAYHLVLIAKNREGYQNLLSIQNDACRNGFFKKPLTTNDVVLAKSKGLICSTACLGSEFNRLAVSGGMEKANAMVNRYAEAFGPDFYMEVQVNEFPQQKQVNAWAESLSGRVKPIFALDAHYMDRGDHDLQFLKMVSRTKMTIEEARNQHKFSDHAQTAWLRTVAESEALRQHYNPEMSAEFMTMAMRSGAEIASKVDLKLFDGKFHYPNFKQDTGLDNFEYFKVQCLEGFRRRITDGDVPVSLGPEYLDQLLYEIDVMKFRKYYDYHLIIAEALEHARSLPGGRVGPGRGSAAGSLVCYCLRITNIDPLKHGLYFERYISPTRGVEPALCLEYK